MTPFTLWTVLWVNPDGGGFAYRTKPCDWVGDGPEVRFYGPDDVIRFKRMIDRLEIPGLTFKCLTNVPWIEGVETVPLICPDLKGWWAKMELFRYSADLPEQTTVGDAVNVYCDLDTIVLSLDGIPDFPAQFAAIKPGKKVGANFRQRWTDKEGRLRVCGLQTSVMVWNGAYARKFWHRFQCDPVTLNHWGEDGRARWMAFYASDQDFLGEQFPSEDKMPSLWFAKIRVCDPAWRNRIRVVLSTPHKNDSAARLYPWISPYWHGPDAPPPKPEKTAS